MYRLTNFGVDLSRIYLSKIHAKGVQIPVSVTGPQSPFPLRGKCELSLQSFNYDCELGLRSSYDDCEFSRPLSSDRDVSHCSSLEEYVQSHLLSSDSSDLSQKSINTEQFCHLQSKDFSVNKLLPFHQSVDSTCLIQAYIVYSFTQCDKQQSIIITKFRRLSIVSNANKINYQQLFYKLSSSFRLIKSFVFILNWVKVNAMNIFASFNKPAFHAISFLHTQNTIISISFNIYTGHVVFKCIIPAIIVISFQHRHKVKRNQLRLTCNVNKFATKFLRPHGKMNTRETTIRTQASCCCASVASQVYFCSTLTAVFYDKYTRLVISKQMRFSEVYTWPNALCLHFYHPAFYFLFFMNLITKIVRNVEMKLIYNSAICITDFPLNYVYASFSNIYYLWLLSWIKSTM